MLKPATIPAKIYYIAAIKYIINKSLLFKLSAGLRHQIYLGDWLYHSVQLIFGVYLKYSRENEVPLDHRS